MSTESLLRNESSFLYGKEPAGNVPIYALVKDCGFAEMESARLHVSPSSFSSYAAANEVGGGGGDRRTRRGSRRSKRVTETTWQDRIRIVADRDKSRRNDADLAVALQTNDLPGNEVVTRADTIRDGNPIPETANRFRKLHFHVTYWMFYPFSEGKAVCVLDLGFFGSWPIPSVGGVCMGKLKEYGNHVGDWEHMSLYFKVDLIFSRRNDQISICYSRPCIPPGGQFSSNFSAAADKVANKADVEYNYLAPLA